MCDVPCIAVFCSESIECFPAVFSKFFFKLLFQGLQLLLVQSYISGSTFVASLYTISCILTSVQLLFAQRFCLRVLPHLSVCIFSLFLFLIIISDLFAVTPLSVCTYYYYYPYTLTKTSCVAFFAFPFILPQRL